MPLTPRVAAPRTAVRAPAVALLVTCARLLGARPAPTQPAPTQPAPADALAAGVRTPPNAARPRFDESLGTPRYVEHRLVWMTPDWDGAFRHAAVEADRLGLEMAMAASGGRSESGGPWVTPAQTMKKVVWSETRVTGPRRLTVALPEPPSVNGPLPAMRNGPDLGFPAEQNMPGSKPLAAEQPAGPDPTFYADTQVLAVRLPDTEVRMAEPETELWDAATGVAVPTAYTTAGGRTRRARRVRQPGCLTCGVYRDRDHARHPPRWSVTRTRTPLAPPRGAVPNDGHALRHAINLVPTR